MEEIRNKVAESGLITINLEQYYPEHQPLAFDLKNFLFMEMLLKEKDFREALDQHDWTQYENKDVAVYCSTDAIVPMWAYMLVASKLSGIARSIISGTPEEAFKQVFIQNIRQLNAASFEGKRVVVKGCGDKPVPEYAYAEISIKLLPVVKSLMYGEPCSTVPVYKRKEKA
jgi:hypothetical protein